MTTYFQCINAHTKEVVKTSTDKEIIIIECIYRSTKWPRVVHYMNTIEKEEE